MKKAIRTIALGVTLALPTAGFAGSEDVVVERPWARASIGTSRPGAAYMTIRNTGTDAVTLTGLRTGIAMMPKIHLSSTDANGVSTMAPAGDIKIAPGEAVTLQPGGLHVMLMKLQGPMEKGARILLTLVFDDGGEVMVEVPILGIAARGPEG